MPVITGYYYTLFTNNTPYLSLAGTSKVPEKRSLLITGIGMYYTIFYHYLSNWGQRYPKVIESWRKNWPRLSSYFQYNKDVRRIMYTTNFIEGFHRQLRAVTKSKGAFQSEEALMKLLFLVQENICAKWNKPVHNWNQTLAQLSIIFSDRLKLNLEI
jgi:hypothetical protein